MLPPTLILDHAAPQVCCDTGRLRRIALTGVVMGAFAKWLTPAVAALDAVVSFNLTGC